MRQAASGPDALAFINSQGAFAKTPEKEFHLSGVKNRSPSFWILFHRYEGRTPEDAKVQWNWKEKAFGRTEEFHNFLTRWHAQYLLTDVEITDIGKKFYVIYCASRLYDAPEIPTPIWNWLKRESDASLLDALSAGTGREKRQILNARTAVIHQSTGEPFYLFY